MLRKMLLAAIVSLTAGTVHANDKVTLLLEWRENGYNGGLHLADKLGYFAEQGIDITITPGGGSGKTVAVIGSGGATFGIADGSTVVTGVSQGMPIKLVGAINNLSPFAVCTRKDRGITKPKDLEGKTIAFTAGTSYANFFPAFLKMHGADISKVRMVNMDYATALTSVIEGRVDGQLGGLDDQCLIPEDKGVPIVMLSGRDYGLQAIGRGIITTDDTIRKNPDLIRRFLLAVKKGYDAAIKDPDAGAEAARAAQEPAARDPLPSVKRHEVVNFTLMKPGAEGKSFISLDVGRLEGQIKMLKDFSGLKTDKVAADFYTDQFVP